VSFEDVKYTFDSIISKQFFVTTIKLNGTNSVIEAQSKIKENNYLCNDKIPHSMVLGCIYIHIEY